jgi:hypothetical protein
MEYLELHNKPKTAVHPELLLTGPLKKKKTKKKNSSNALTEKFCVPWHCPAYSSHTFYLI